MPISDLTEQERGVVHACLRAAIEGPFFPDQEFHSRFGLDRSEVQSVVLGWPEIDDSVERIALAIINAMANLLSYPHGKPEELRHWVSASDAEILRVLYKWQGEPAADPARLVKQLGDLMSGISEACYAAGWYAGTEYMVPELCRRALQTGEVQSWASGEITPAMARHLNALAERLGNWANLSEDATGYVAFDPFPTPDEHLQELDFWKRKKNGG